MNRFYACLAVSILLHVSILVPLQIMERHSLAASLSVIRVSIIDRPLVKSLGETPAKAETSKQVSVANDNNPPVELVRKSATEEKSDSSGADDISYEKGAKVDPSYHGKLKAKIFSMYSYPEEAVEKGIQGTAIISFVIEPSGEVSSLRIKKSSGNDILDGASLKAVRNASPFQPLEKSLEIDATFRYVLE